MRGSIERHSIAMTGAAREPKARSTWQILKMNKVEKSMQGIYVSLIIVWRSRRSDVFHSFSNLDARGMKIHSAI